MDKLSNIFLEGTPKSPQVDFNPLSGELILFGRSIPEDAAKVYLPLINWTKEYIKCPREVTNFRINLEYYNTASQIWFSKIIKLLCNIENPEYIVLVHVYFDKDDFDSMQADDLQDFLDSIINVQNVKVKIGIKAYGIEEDGRIDKESLILLESKFDVSL